MEMAEMGSAHVFFPAHVQTLFTSPTTLPRTMSKLFALLAILAGVASAAPESLYEDQAELMESEARFLYFNSSSTATSLTLLGAVILLGVIFYLVYVGGLLAPVGGSQYSRYGQDYANGGYGYQNQARYDMSLSLCLSLRMSRLNLTPACNPPCNPPTKTPPIQTSTNLLSPPSHASPLPAPSRHPRQSPTQPEGS